MDNEATMHLSISREEFLKALSIVAGVVEKRQAKPLLSHILIQTQKDGGVTLTGTDLEIEMVMMVAADIGEEGSITVPGRKLLDIVRALPAESMVRLQTDGDRVKISAGRSRFQLSTLPVEDFPSLKEEAWEMSFTMNRSLLHRVIEKTQFCMAQQDVRYYLNGLMFETLPGSLKAVGADGHRLAMCTVALSGDNVIEKQVIVPRKGVAEMARFLGSEEGDVEVRLSGNHIQVRQDKLIFTSKLIDGRFPDYNRVVPASVKEVVLLPREALREMLTRVGIVSTEKFRGIRLEFNKTQLIASASNPERDEAVEELELEVSAPEFEVGFNVGYLIEAISAMSSAQVELGWNDSNSGCRLKPAAAEEGVVYVVMPMRL
ncbi:MAG TPA: DNA polymerase III subunit beta [Acidiferrobacter sp.]|nr:DNA polymerase III subunit beta [Acidiferrobacter sp.]